MSSNRFLVVTDPDTVDYAKNNGYEVYDIIQDTFDVYDNVNNTIKTNFNNTYYFEYTQELYWLLVTRGGFYMYENFGNFSIGQIADLISSYPLPRMPITQINNLGEEELDVVNVVELAKPTNDAIEYMKQKGYNPDLCVRFNMFLTEYWSTVYKINYIGRDLDERSKNLIECIEGYEKKSINGKISVSKKIVHKNKKLTS